jgi:two-component system, OmpR family, sensor histidine kinase NblS
LLETLQSIQATLARWWSQFTLQTKLMAVATLVISLLMSSITFWAVNTIQQDARLNDTRFGRDLGLLLAANVAPLVAKNDRPELARFTHYFYSSTVNVRYILYADQSGEIYLGIPFSESEVQNSLTLKRRINLPENFSDTIEVPLVRQHLTPDGEVTDVFVPLNYEGHYLGSLAIGTNPNPTIVTSSHLTRDVTLAVFVSIWVMMILGSVFNALIITQPIKELLTGVKNIAAGNFHQQVALPFGGEIGELIVSFNEMAQRLERYDEQNIEELTAEKAKLDTLMATIADGAVLLDQQHHIVLANPTARRIFIWDSEPLIGEDILQHLPPDIQGLLKPPLLQIAQGKSEGTELRLTLPDPANRTLRLLLSSVWDQHRETVKGIAMTVQDITREAELNEAKSQFISNISHELRTPLFNIKSFIETLHEYGDDLTIEQRQDFLETANRETDRLTRLVNDVLDLSRLESGKRYHLDAVELDVTVEQTLRSHQLHAKDKGITLKQDIESELPPALGNYDLLLQVFTNLVGNALKFTEAGGEVMIRAYRLPRALSTQVEGSDLGTVANWIRVEISDTGIGIDLDDQDCIFDRFFRVENRVHTLEGTGLGLSIVHNIIEKHQSRVHLVSEPGTGTTFWFDLQEFQEPQRPEIDQFGDVIPVRVHERRDEATELASATWPESAKR